MEVTRFADAPAYAPPNHEEVQARRLQGGEATSAAFALVGYTDIPPGAAVPMEAGPTGKIYVVVAGTICVGQQDGAAHRLERYDSIFIPAGEARSILNDTDAAAAIIVVMPPAKGA